MGGSTLGTQKIYDFLKDKIKKKFFFIDNLQNYKKKESKQKYLNLIVSKSGNTIETIVNSNILIKNKDKNIFITENKKNYLHDLAEKLKQKLFIIIIILVEDILFYRSWHASRRVNGFKW